MAYHSRTPQKRFTQGYRSSPYGPSPKKHSASGTSKFDPQLESLDAPGLHVSPDLELARRDPLHHYTIRTGFFKGKTLAHAHIENPSYLKWMRDKYYDALRKDSIVRKALDQWAAESGGASGSWSMPPLPSAPLRFRNDNGTHMYMQERFLKKAWKTTPAELEAAGAKFTVSAQSKTKAKKFALFHVYEYVKAKGRLSASTAGEAAENEITRIIKTRANFQNFKDGVSGSYGDFGDMDDLYGFPYY